MGPCGSFVSLENAKNEKCKKKYNARSSIAYMTPILTVKKKNTHKNLHITSNLANSNSIAQ
jgi:hypothetical protein